MNFETLSSSEDSRFDYLDWELCATADSATTIVRMSPRVAALRSATMLRGGAPLAVQSESARAPTVKSAAASASLEADLDTVFIDDHCGKIFARFGIADGNGVAGRAVFHGEGF